MVLPYPGGAMIETVDGLGSARRSPVRRARETVEG
jgi:hypothetical protein